MSTATLTFNLADEDDKFSYETVLQASEMRSALDDILRYLREQTKYADPPDDIHTARDKIFEMLKENSVDLDKMG